MVGRFCGRILGLGMGLIVAVAPALACTGLMLRTSAGAPVHGRTLEFGMYIDTDVVVVPRGFGFTGTTPLGEGLSWEAKYGAAGMIAFGNMAILDGLNEQGLAVGAFYFPGFAGYAETNADNQAKALSPADFPGWVLTSFATVDEVKAAIAAGDVVIAPTLLPGFPPEPQPFHYVVYDASGAAIVIEPVDGDLVVTDNPLGVITNSPSFDWHMTNLRNYVGLDPNNVPAVKVAGESFSQLGQGSGMMGLPGDFTPPSRFVRAAVFGATATPVETSEEAVTQMFHILNNFDIPVGLSRAEVNGTVETDYTLLTAVRDPSTLRYYWKSYDDQTIRFVDLKAVDLDAGAVLSLSTKSTQPLVDETAALK